jgi:hypothetical protein
MMMLDDEAVSASATGILQCLRLLAEEAAVLNLQRTLLAIQDALEAVADETGEVHEEPAISRLMPPVLH